MGKERLRFGEGMRWFFDTLVPFFPSIVKTGIAVRLLRRLLVFKTVDPIRCGATLSLTKVAERFAHPEWCW